MGVIRPHSSTQMQPQGLQPVYETLLQQVHGIESLMEQRLLYPSLVLIYSSIDAVAALAGPAEKISVEARFTRWLDRYLLPIKPMRARSIDLYAARCGLLHTLTSDADLVAKDRAVAISYAWGNADPEILQDVIDRTVPGQTVAVHVSDLAVGFRFGTLSTFEDAASDAELKDRIEQGATRFFAHLPSDPLKWKQASSRSV